MGRFQSDRRAPATNARVTVQPLRRIAWLSLSCMGLFAACGDSDSTTEPDPPPEECAPVFVNERSVIPEPFDGSEYCAPGDCNYQSQLGCGDDESCRPHFPAGATDVVPGCQPTGSVTSGEPCEDSSECARGLLCVAGACRKMCCGADWSACDAGESCIRQFFVDFGDRQEHAVDLCFPVGGCDLFDPATCQERDGIVRACQIVDPTGAVACAPTAANDAGDSCETEPCAQGFTCLGGECRRLCRAEACGEPACPPEEGPCVHFDRNPPGVGECTPEWDQ